MASVEEIMNTATCSVRPEATLIEAARLMRDDDVGDVIVLGDDGRLAGILTDRDIAVRAIAAGMDPRSTRVADICSGEPVTVAPGDAVGTAIERMSQNAVRRIPVVDGGRAVGIVSLGDLAIERDPDSALADISAAPPNR